MVRLITHNLLACHVKNCTSNNFPLAFNNVQIELREAEFNSDFLRGFLPKIEWDALANAAREVRVSGFNRIMMGKLIIYVARGYIFTWRIARDDRR